MYQAEGKRQADAFYKESLPFGMARYVGCEWRSFTDAEAEFCFERLRKGKRERVCIVLCEKHLTGSEEDLDGFLKATLEPSFHGYEQCKRDYVLAVGGQDRRGPRAWSRKN